MVSGYDTPRAATAEGAHMSKWKKEGHVLNRCCAAESLLGPCVFVEIIFWLDKG